MKTNLNIFEKIRTYHEKTKDGIRTGRSITVLWKNDQRYVGISRCSVKDQFSRKKGRLVSLSRAIHTFEVFSGAKDRLIDAELMFSFNINDASGVDLPEFVYLEKTEATNG